MGLEKKSIGIFLGNQILGAGANLLQQYSVALAPFVFVPLVSALQGTQHVFLLIFTIFLSIRYPQILKEDILGKTIFQKIIAILLIGVGLILLILL